MTLKLNIGAGTTELEGFTPIDRKLGSEAYPLADISDDSVEEIRASHILEHFSFAQVPKVLKEWVRVLAPGGIMRLAVPDVDKIMARRHDQLWRHYLMGGQTDADNYHRCVFDTQHLQAVMEHAGLVDVKPWVSKNTDTAAHPVSLNLQGMKPTLEGPMSADALDLKIAAVCSIPRLGWNDHWGIVTEALRPFRIPIRTFTGAFWGQCIEAALESCVRDNLDWVLTLDYDTLFSAEHLDTLLGTFGRYPGIDALAGLQMRRNHKTPLMTVGDGAGGKSKGVEVDGSPIVCETAHFGMTLLRVEHLKTLPKPWFKHVPAPDGTWAHPEHIDADIYFWKQWAKAGLTVCVDPKVRIGHLECLVSEVDEQMTHRHVTVGDWRKEHLK